MTAKNLGLITLFIALALTVQPAMAQPYPTVDTTQITGDTPASSDNVDGTVTDEVTGPFGQQSPNTDSVDGDHQDTHGAVRFDTRVEGGPLGEGGERYYNFVRYVRDE